MAANLLCLDLAYLCANETPYWQDPVIVSKINSELNNNSNNVLRLLYKISELSKNPVITNDELEQIKSIRGALIY